MKMTSI